VQEVVQQKLVQQKVVQQKEVQEGLRRGWSCPEKIRRHGERWAAPASLLRGGGLVRGPNFQILNPRSETLSPKPQTLNPKPEP
jgi:hypothetical protein